MFRKAGNAIRIGSGISAERNRRRRIMQLLDVLLCNLQSLSCAFQLRDLSPHFERYESESTAAFSGWFDTNWKNGDFTHSGCSAKP